MAHLVSRKRIGESKILAVGGGFPDIGPAIRTGMGMDVVEIALAEANDAWEAADKDEARAVADRWEESAARIEGVSREIYAHCVASNRAFGSSGEANPFEILTHSEDRQGASVRSLLPLGYMTTTGELAPEWQEILFHQGRSVENVIEDRACRTKLAVEPIGDFEKLFTEWDRWGWHRVTVYGDLKEAVFALADNLGWKIVQEA
jgi:hypothetical protein